MSDVVIRNQCALERIDPCFMPLVVAARDGVLTCCGKRLRELRLLGSIARGDARVGNADLDMTAILDGACLEEENRCLTELAARLGAVTQVVSRLDLEAVDGTGLELFRRFVLSSDSLCIHGVDSLTLPEQSVERSALAGLVTPDPTMIVPDYVGWVEELMVAGDEERSFASRIIGKDFLKVLRGVLLLRGAPYATAIPMIATQVPTFAPEASQVAGHLFAIYREPTADLDVIRRATSEAASFFLNCPELTCLHGRRDAEPHDSKRSIS